MSENESDKQPVTAEDTTTTQPAADEPAKVEATYTPVEPAGERKSKVGMYIAAIVIVALTLLAVLFLLEKEGRSSTGIFDSYFAAQDNTATVAVVNGEEITGRDLATSIQQFNQAAIAQGVDTTNPDVAADIRGQALEVLVNTELLKQAAEEQGIEISTEATAERLATIEAEIGGPEVLQERIGELGLTQDDLERDITEELLIQALLDGIFAEANIEVTEEEVLEVYNAAGGADAGLPPLEEVRAQVEAQVQSTKEQAVIDEYLETLKIDAEIEAL